MAVAGLILSIIGVVSALIGSFVFPILSILGLPIAITGLVLSVVAGKKQKSGLATAGLVIGIIATIFTAIDFFTCGICVLCVSSTVAGIGGLL